MSDTVTPLKAHPTCSALRGALYIFEAAAVAGLPIPTHVTTSSYAAVRYGNSGTDVDWQPESLDDLYRWAEYLEVEVDAHETNDGAIHHRVAAEVFDQRVSLVVIERVTA